MPPINELFRDMLSNFGLERVYVNGTGFVPNFQRGIRVSGANVSTTELSALDVTAGTITASKAVVLDANKKASGGQLSRFISGITAASTSLAATTATTFSNGTVTLPVLAAGDRVRIRGAISIATGAGSQTFQYLVKIGGQTLFDLTALANATTGDYHVFDVEFTLRTVHASTGTGYVSAIVSGEADEVGYSTSTIGAITSLASSAAMDVIVQGAFGGASQSALLQQFDVSVN
jgi:hypothetical protein